MKLYVVAEQFSKDLDHEKILHKPSHKLYFMLSTSLKINKRELKVSILRFTRFKMELMKKRRFNFNKIHI